MQLTKFYAFHKSLYSFHLTVLRLVFSIYKFSFADVTTGILSLQLEIFNSCWLYDQITFIFIASVTTRLLLVFINKAIKTADATLSLHNIFFKDYNVVYCHWV